MTDEELVDHLLAIDQMSVEDCFCQSTYFIKAADRIKQLTAERDYTEGTNDTLIALNQSLTADNARLLAKCETLGQEVNMAKYGQPDFAWSIHKAAMAELQADNARYRKLLDAIVDEYNGQIHGPALYAIIEARAALNTGKEVMP